MEARRLLARDPPASKSLCDFRIQVALSREDAAILRHSAVSLPPNVNPRSSRLLSCRAVQTQQFCSYLFLFEVPLVDKGKIHDRGFWWQSVNRHKVGELRGERKRTTLRPAVAVLGPLSQAWQLGQTSMECLLWNGMGMVKERPANPHGCHKWIVCCWLV